MLFNKTLLTSEDVVYRERLEWVDALSRLSLVILGILALANVGITPEALGWSCVGLGVVCCLARVLYFQKKDWKDGFLIFDTLLILSAIAVACLGALSLISPTDVAWCMVGLNAVTSLLMICTFACVKDKDDD